MAWFQTGLANASCVLWGSGLKVVVEMVLRLKGSLVLVMPVMLHVVIVQVGGGGALAEGGGVESVEGGAGCVGLGRRLL